MIENNYFLENQDLQENFQSIVNWKEIIDGFEGDFEDHKEYQKTGKESLGNGTRILRRCIRIL